MLSEKGDGKRINGKNEDIKQEGKDEGNKAKVTN